MERFEGLEILEPVFRAHGYVLAEAKPGPTSSGIATFRSDADSVQVICDKGQWFFGGDRPDLERLGVWKVFENAAELARAVPALIAGKRAPKEEGIRTRIAPTPSGYLHLGNLASFLLTEKCAKGGGTLALRIDDCDATRARPEFVEHIFETLRWLGIEWQEGPRDAEDFARNFSQAARKEKYFERLAPLGNLLFACECSRKEIDGEYQGTCRDKGLAFVRGKHALRVRLPEFHDPVLWRKDDGPAYQWVSVLDDLEAKTNLIVRGEDLRSSSELQKRLAKLLTPEGFDKVRFLHHPLLLDEKGEKLAKSQKAESVVELRGRGATAAELRAQLRAVLASWGF